MNNENNNNDNFENLIKKATEFKLRINFTGYFVVNNVIFV